MIFYKSHEALTKTVNTILPSLLWRALINWRDPLENFFVNYSWRGISLLFIHNSVFELFDCVSVFFRSIFSYSESFGALREDWTLKNFSSHEIDVYLLAYRRPKSGKIVLFQSSFNHLFPSPFFCLRRRAQDGFEIVWDNVDVCKKAPINIIRVMCVSVRRLFELGLEMSLVHSILNFPENLEKPFQVNPCECKSRDSTSLGRRCRELAREMRKVSRKQS